MTLGFYKDNMELFRNCVLHWTGVSETNLGFPTLPDGVTVTPAGTWDNPLDLGTNKTLKTFDGSTNYISLTDNAAWAFSTGDFTISLWYKLTSISEVKFLFHLYTDANNQMFSYINQQMKPHQSPCFSVKVGGSYPVDFYTSHDLSLDTWYHIAYVRSGTSWRIYEDGALTASITATVTIPDFTSGFNIGRSVAVTANRLHGNIKDLLIYKGRALTLPELTTIMRLTHPTTGSGLLPLYPGVGGVE